jgi:hypothetical protein
VRWLGTILRYPASILIIGADHAAPEDAPTSRLQAYRAARRLCAEQGGTFSVSADLETFTCVAPEWTTFTRRELMDGKTLCETTCAGEWEDVFHVWYTCRLPD